MSEQHDNPLVSVITIFFNAERFIEEAISSVLAQAYDHWELLLVDDGSTDESSEIARRYAKRFPDRLRYLEHEGHQNRGMSTSRNLGIRHAGGKYVAFLDADDVWLPEKLKHQVPVLESQPDTGMLYGPTEYWHSWTGNSQDLRRDHVPDLGVPLDSLIQPPTLLTMLYPLGHGPAPCICSLLVRNDVLRRIGGFEDSFPGYYEDQAFLTKVYLSERVFVSSGCWDKYRIHAGSCSAAVEQSGQYDAHRRSYLEWFKSFLTSRRVTSPEVWKALDDALAASQRPQEESGRQWYLRVAEGNQARLVRTTGGSEILRVDIARNASAQPYDTQLNLPRLKVAAAERCVLSFQARADAPREISLGLAMGHSPWSNLGLYARLSLETEWRRFEQAFVVTADESDARIHFDLGGSEVSVELSAVTLLNPSEERFIEQEHSASEPGPVRPANAPVEPPVPVNDVQFGSFRRLTPISRDFGCDRGRPIDRYYIESFLARRQEDVRGRVLEIGENTYTRSFGGDRVTRSDILHVTEGEPQATIIADLASADHIPSNSFDCIILTQTLQLIYDVPAALRTLHRILEPSGVLLATFPGISQSYDHEWAATWYWNFTAVSARRLFEDAFSAEHVHVEAFGNVMAAMSFLHGLAVEELTPEELDYREPGYDVTITVRAVKAAAGGPAERGAGDIRESKGNRRSGNAGNLPAIILMYHRVAEGGTDPFSLGVSPHRFAEHLEVLRKHVETVSLQDFVATLDNGGVSRPTAVITFDDGYADNLLHAKPVLERYAVPATVFLTTGYLGGQREFWWDELDRLLLQPGVLPRTLQLTIDGTAHEWDLGKDADYAVEHWRRHDAWVVSQPPPTARHAVFLATWRLFQFVPDDQRHRLFDELRSWAGVREAVRPTHRQLCPDEVVTLVRDGLIEAGAHTVTHPVLARLPATLQREEIQQSVARVEAIIGHRVSSFAYPFGSQPDFTDKTADIVRDVGCLCACSTVPGVVPRHPDRFQLPRCQIEDWSGEEFARRLAKWLNR